MMRIMGCGRRQLTPIVQPSVANRVEQLCKEIFRAVSHCFASIPLLNRVIAPASLKVVHTNQPPIWRALHAFKQFAYVHKKKWIATAAIGAIGFLVYSLGKKEIRLPVNQPQSSSLLIRWSVLKNVVHPAVSLAGVVCLISATCQKMLFNSRLEAVNAEILRMTRNLHEAPRVADRSRLESWVRIDTGKKERLEERLTTFGYFMLPWQLVLPE